MSTTKRITKRLLAVVLTVMMLMSMITIGMTSASAAKVELAETSHNLSSGTVFYFDNSDTKWTDSVIQLMVGHNTYSKGYKMTKVSNSDLYYVSVGDNWGDATQLAVFGISGSSAWGGENNNISHRKNYASHSTAVYNMSGNFSGRFVIYPNAANTTLTPEWKTNTSTDYAAFNETQTVAVQSNVSGAYANDAAAATVTISTYKLTGTTTASATTASGAIASADAVRSADVTLSYGDVAEGYTFVGWYEGDTLLSTDATYTYDFDGGVTNDYTARFEYTATEVTSSSADASEDASEDASSSTGEVESQPTTTEPTVTDPAEPNGTAFELDWAESSGLYAYAGATDDAIDAEAWQRWLSKSEGRVFYLPASASKTEVIIYNSYSNTVTVNGVKIDAGCYNTVPYVAGTTYTITDAENQKLTIYNTDAEASLFINTDEAKGSVVNDDDAETETALSALSGIWYDYITAASKNREAKKLGGAVASDDGIVVEQVKKIKGRGNTTWEETKKPFNITFKNAVGIDGMDAAEKWSLLANAKDDSLMRNRIVYDMANEVGMKYACDSRFVDFFVDGRYMGSYQLVQKIEMGEGTVMGDLVEPEVEDVVDDDTGETITYPKENFDFVLELDTQKNADNAGDLTFTTSRGQVMTHKIPDKPAAEQVQFMKAKYQAVEDALYGDDLETLETLVDMNDLAKAYLINEISKNVDAGITSCYFVYNADDGIFYLSPVWDYDNALGNMGDTTRQDINGNNLALSQPSGWYASELAHYDSNFTGKHSVFSKACYTTSTTADGKTFADYVDAVWESDFADLIDILEGTVDGNGRLKSIDDYKALLAKSGQWNYENNRINDGWTLKQNWTSDHSSLTMFDYDADANTYTSETKSYNAYDAQDMNQYAGDWAISRLNWLTAQYADADVDVPDGYITIYFENNWQWPDAKVYYWGSTIGTNPEWNGIPLSNVVGQNDQGYDIYEIVIPEDITGLLFNGTGEFGAEQSADITSGWYEGICYYMTYDSATNTKPCGSYDYKVPQETTSAPAETTSAPAETDPTEGTTASKPASGDQNVTDATETTTTETPVAETMTIYFENNWKWTNLRVYWWGSQTGTNPAWNAQEMEYVDTTKDGYDRYVIEVPSDITGLIFNGTSSTSGNEQCADITEGWYDGICYYMTYDGTTNTKPAKSYTYEPIEEETSSTATVTEPTEATTEATEATTASKPATGDQNVTDATETTTTETPVAETMTIYFENNWKWTNLRVYWWGSQTGTNPAWNAQEMEYVDTTKDGYDRYVIEVPSDITGLIFNGTSSTSGNEQCADITEGWYDGICYYMTYDGTTNTKPAKSYTYEPIEEETSSTATVTEPTEATTEATEATTDSKPATGDQDATESTTESGPDMPTVITVYAINSAKWDEVYVYAWATDPAVAWPGVAMDKTEDTVNGFDVYALSFDSAYVNVIFNNNNKGAQTADLTAMDGQYYDIKGGQWYASLEEVPAVSTLSTDRYIVGEFNGWSTTANEFKLKAEGESYGYVTLTLEANTTYEFKIVREGAWTSCTTPITATVEGLTFSSSNSDNCTITTTEAGEYVFAFGINNSQLSVTYPGEEVTDPTDPTPDTTVKLAGDFTDWGTGAIEMTADENGTVYTTEQYFAAGTYKFKVVEFGKWLGNDGTINNEMAEAGGWTFKDGAGNCTLTTTGGTYTFTFDTVTDKLTVTAVLDPIVTPVYDVTWNESENFTVNAPATIDEAATLTFTVDAAEDYVIAAVIYNMTKLEAVDGVYTIENVQGDVELLIVEAEKTGDDTGTETPDIPVVEQKLTVMFVDYDNTILAVAKVDKGTNLPAPEAPTRAGYTFTGWSADTSNVQADMIVVANYKKIVTPVAPATHGTLQIDVTGGTGFTLTINDVTRPQGTTYLNKKAPIDATVTVVANSTNGNEFLGWINTAGAVVSTSEEYTFVTSGNDILKAVYRTSIDDVSFVVFKNAEAAQNRGQYLDMQYYVSGDKVVYPDDARRSGYDFVGWKFAEDTTDTEITDEMIQAKLAAGEDMTIVAMWKRMETGYNITVNNGKLTGSKNSAGEYIYNTTAIATANAPESGMKFAYWVDENNIIKSYDAEYTFFVYYAQELTAVYVASDKEITYEPILEMFADPNVEGEYIKYIATWDIDESIGKVTNSGLLLVNANDYDESTFYHGSGDSKLILDRSFGAADAVNTGSKIINKNNSYVGNTYIATFWIVYTDANGQTQTIHADPVTVEKLTTVVQ